MRYLASDRSSAGSRSGRSPRRAALFVLFLAAKSAIAQTPQKPAHRANELTLCGLRPGKDNAASANRRMGLNSGPKPETKEGQLSWSALCYGLALIVDLDGLQKIQVLRLTHWVQAGDCFKPTPWKTGRGLRLGDATAIIIQLYGEPDSRSPSTKDRQPLELWYYAFDWAGPDVPQVMEVLCTKEQDGHPRIRCGDHAGSTKLVTR